MGKMSARRIGQYLGLAAQSVNERLKEAGLLDGESGAYSLTEMGKEYGQEQDHDNGYGGYAYRSWTTRTWDSSIIPKLDDDWDPASVDWYCDHCDAYMNEQPGFDGVGPSWICANCQTENDVTASNLR